MKKIFKIFEIYFREEIIVPGHYDDGYGKESLNNPIFKGINDWKLNSDFDTLEEAEYAIKWHGSRFVKYAILHIYIND